MYLLCMIKTRFLLYSMLFLISQTSYGTYKIISSYELSRPVMGTIFFNYVHVSVVCQINCVGGITWPTRMLKVIFAR